MTPKETRIDISLLKELFILDAEAGMLYWKKRPARHFQSSMTTTAESKAKRWNARYAGKPALASRCKNGGRYGDINGTHGIPAYRVIFALVNGRWPKHQIDHINGNRSDDRPGNLREATPTENMRNRKKQKNNSSGVCGVSFHVGRQKYEARIRADGVRKHLGMFRTLNEAVSARKAAERKYGYHQNHGR